MPGQKRPLGLPRPITAVRGRGQSLLEPRFTDPLRHPELASEQARVRRAWVLLLLTFLLPGSAQLLMGQQKLGRRALLVTASFWAFLLFLVFGWFNQRALLLSVLTHSFVLLLLSLSLLLLAVGWIFLLLHTARLIRPLSLPARPRALISALVVASLIVTGGGLGYGAYVTWLGRGALGAIFAGSSPLAEQEGRYNILLMGGDAGSDRVGRRPDSMTVVSIDAQSGQALTISVPRNLQNAIFEEGSPLWSVYPEGFNCGDECILNALYPTVATSYADLYPGAADPGAEATLDAVSGVLGIRVEHYVLVDMSGFENLIDALGGISIEVGGPVPIGGGTDPITGLPNPIEGYIQPGLQHLDGYHALWYARSREGASDYDRQARQRCVQAAMLKQLDPANVLTKFADITAAGEEVIETNIPQAGLAALADVALKSKQYDLIQFAAGPPYFDDLFPTYPDFDLLQQRVDQVIADSTQGISPTPLSQAAASSSSPTVPEAGSESGALVLELASYRVQLVSELSANGTCSVP